MASEAFICVLLLLFLKKPYTAEHVGFDQIVDQGYLQNQHNGKLDGTEDQIGAQCFPEGGGIVGPGKGDALNKHGTYHGGDRVGDGQTGDSKAALQHALE